jgi:hypothetical protein
MPERQPMPPGVAGCVMVPGSQPAPRRLMPRCLAVPQSNTVVEVLWDVLIRGVWKPLSPIS